MRSHQFRLKFLLGTTRRLVRSMHLCLVVDLCNTKWKTFLKCNVLRAKTANIAHSFEYSYLCPSSCVIVCAKVIPLSSLTLHDLSTRHIPPTFAMPSVLQPEFEQMFCLVTRMATSWCVGSSSFFGFKVRCHLSFGKREGNREGWKISML